MDGGAWWAAVHGVAKSRTRLTDFTFTFHFHALEMEMAAHSSVLAWRVPGMGEPGGLPSMGSHRVGHDWSDLAAAATHRNWVSFGMCLLPFSCPEQSEATPLCFCEHLTRSFTEPRAELQTTDLWKRFKSREKNGVLCTWRPVRKNQFAWKWRCHFPQGWFVLLKLLTRLCRNVPWNRGFSQVECEKTLTLGWAQVAGERLYVLMPTPHHVEGRPLWTVCHCSSSLASSGLAEDHKLLSVWWLGILIKEKKRTGKHDRASLKPWTAFFPPCLPRVCALFEIKLLFSSITNDGEREKKKPTQGWKVVASYSWLPALAKKAVPCPQLTPGRQALCKWEAVSMSAHLRLSSRKEREKKKKTTDIINKKNPKTN